MELFLLALAVVVVYGLLCLVSPHKTCPKCKGERVVKRRGCPRCKVRGKVQRPGAVLVHRLFWLVLGDARRERRKAQLKGDGDV
jgi:hypothetical protein